MVVNAVVDLSHWNARWSICNFKAAKTRDDLLGVIYKATEGRDYVDPTYERSRSLAEKEGLLWGAYHFGVNGSGCDQASHFLKTVGNNGSGVLLALDVEERTMNNMTEEQASDFVTEVKRATGKWPLIYGSPSFLGEGYYKYYTFPALTQCPLWVADWGAKDLESSPRLPKGWTTWKLWQYTDGTKGPKPHGVDGIGTCDRNIFNGTVEELNTFWKEFSA